MRLLRIVAAAALLAGCGASSTGTLGAAGSSAEPSPAPPTVASPAPSAVASVGASAVPSPSPTHLAVVSATAGSATVGPGRITSPAGSPSPRPTPSPTAGTVTVTDADSGATVRLAVGQHLRVELSNGTWDPPSSSADTIVVRRSSRGGYPSSQPVDATFDAVGRGSADVTAQSDAACFHTEPRCMMAQREWRVTVVVR